MFQRSRRATTFDLTAEEEALGFCGPITRVRNKKSASHAANSQHFTPDIIRLVEEVRDHGQQGRDAGFGDCNC